MLNTPSGVVTQAHYSGFSQGYPQNMGTTHLWLSGSELSYIRQHTASIGQERRTSPEKTGDRLNNYETSGHEKGCQQICGLNPTLSSRLCTADP